LLKITLAYSFLNFERGEFGCKKIEDVDVASVLEMTACG
jgi:hypothetical protein